MDMSADASTDIGTNGRWMTFAESATARGIHHTSARRAASRDKWWRQKDNHRIVRVCVSLCGGCRVRLACSDGGGREARTRVGNRLAGAARAAS
jgi:hypothetical protein